MTILIDSGIVRDGIGSDESTKCPKHPTAEITYGYGLAGGGVGSYTYCERCGRLLSKQPEPIDEE